MKEKSKQYSAIQKINPMRERASAFVSKQVRECVADEWKYWISNLPVLVCHSRCSKKYSHS